MGDRRRSYIFASSSSGLGINIIGGVYSRAPAAPSEINAACSCDRTFAPPPLTHTHIGTDFHGAMVATAPEKKLLIGRCPVRNWTQLQCFSLFPLNLLHLLLGKSTKTAATRAALFGSNMHQIVCRLGLRPRPHLENLQHSPRPTTCI